jgi:hypothetical protein
MTDINDLVKEFWNISSGGAVAVAICFTAMRHLLDIFEVGFIIFVLLLSALLIKINRIQKTFLIMTTSTTVKPSPIIFSLSSRHYLMSIERCLINLLSSHFLNPHV